MLAADHVPYRLVLKEGGRIILRVGCWSSASQNLRALDSHTLRLPDFQSLTTSLSRTLQPLIFFDCCTRRPSHLRTLILSDSLTFRVSVSRTRVLSDSQTLSLSDAQTLTLWHSQTLALSHFHALSDFQILKNFQTPMSSEARPLITLTTLTSPSIPGEHAPPWRGGALIHLAALSPLASPVC